MQYRIYHITNLNLDIPLIDGQWATNQLVILPLEFILSTLLGFTCIQIRGKFNSVYVCAKPLDLCLVI